jgi:hypothetical protein
MTTFQGTEEEIIELVEAIRHNCTCPALGTENPHHKDCSANSLLILPPKQLNQILFMRRYWTEHDPMQDSSKSDFTI